MSGFRDSNSCSVTVKLIMGHNCLCLKLSSFKIFKVSSVPSEKKITDEKITYSKGLMEFEDFEKTLIGLSLQRRLLGFVFTEYET